MFQSEVLNDLWTAGKMFICWFLNWETIFISFIIYPISKTERFQKFLAQIQQEQQVVVAVLDSFFCTCTAEQLASWTGFKGLTAFVGLGTLMLPRHPLLNFSQVIITVSAESANYVWGGSLDRGQTACLPAILLNAIGQNPKSCLGSCRSITKPNFDYFFPF